MFAVCHKKIPLEERHRNQTLSTTTYSYFEQTMPRNRQSFAAQVAANRKSLAAANANSSRNLVTEIEDTNDIFSQPFDSRFKPGEMRQLALVAHNHMKPAMKEFIETYSEVLKKFRITGTNTTMR